MAYSKRDYTTREEREQMVIDRGNPTNSSKSKMSQYLSQENVKNFNRIVVSRNFDKLHDNYKSGFKKQVFTNYEECLEEVEGYFKLCDQYNIIPTIASLSLYLGVNRDTIYAVANDPRTYVCSDILKTAIATCQGYHEQAFMSNEISPVSFIFYAKNYYGMKDQTDVNVSANNQDNTINSNTMQTIKEQIKMEEEQKQLEYLKENSSN